MKYNSQQKLNKLIISLQEAQLFLR